MNRLSGYMCCRQDEDDTADDPHEIELLKDMECDVIHHSDDSVHWKGDKVDEDLGDIGGDNQAEDGWLAVQPNMFQDEAAALNAKIDEERIAEEKDYSSSDMTSKESSMQHSEEDQRVLLDAEKEINVMILSPTDPCGKVSYCIITTQIFTICTPYKIFSVYLGV